MLSVTKIRNAKPAEKPYKLYDGDGLFVLVHPNGSKYLRFKYRFQKKEKVLALGVWRDGDTKDSLKLAREKRNAARKLLDDGIDPSEQKQANAREALLSAENTFEAIAREWHRLQSKRWTSGHSHKNMRRFELHLFPSLGKRIITDIKPQEILRIIRQVEKRGTTEVTKRLVQLTSSTFRYAILTGRAEYNPAADLRGALEPHETRHYPTIHESELPQFFKDLEDASTSRLNKLAMKLSLLAFLRPGELRHGEWVEIDEDTAIWAVPNDRMKKRNAHTVPLSSQALEVLRSIKQLSGDSQYMFPTQNPQINPTMSEGTLTQMLKRMGYKDRMSWHGVRALASTTLREIGEFDDLVVEKQLSHKDQNASRQPYNRAEYAAQRQRMMQWWGDFLESKGLFDAY